VKISQFMREALFDEKSGYYRTKNPIGKDADFITAPEISQIFGELIAVYLLQIFSLKKGKISLVEMGAGRGVLFYDILQTIKKLAKKNSLAADFIDSADLHIIEINDILKVAQQEKLAEFRISWHQKFEDFSSKNNLPIFFISNELFDCFPIDQFVKTDIGWCERLIDSGRFITKNFDPKIDQFVQEIVGRSAPFGAVFEHSESAQNLMKQLCESLRNFGGIAINFDYGYFESELANTLQAVKNNQKVGVLKDPGNVDISAHVDFGALDKIAKKFDLKTSLITQREFLLSLGIEERAKNLLNQNSAIERLVSPSQMGELFKCHIIWKENE
jgi:NADH dehydrogenase [ubiquinone] 1 alpha subcomplex assembly factor 7